MKPGADLGFSRGDRFSKKKLKILSTFFLGRPNFSELSQFSITQFDQIFCATQIFHFTYMNLFKTSN